MYRSLIIFGFFLCSSCNPYNGTFSNYDSRQKAIADSNIVLKENNRITETKPVDDDQQKIIQGNQARGLDSLLGMKKTSAMPVLSKYNVTEVSGHQYPYIEHVFKIENINKWSHPTTLYIFIDSSDRVCKMNYFFKEALPIENAKNLADSMSWALPIRKYPEHPHSERIFICEEGAWDRPQLHHFGGKKYYVTSWQDDYYSELRRLFIRQNKPCFIYSVAIMYHPLCHNGEILPDDIYEPILDTNK